MSQSAKAVASRPPAKRTEPLALRESLQRFETSPALEHRHENPAVLARGEGTFPIEGLFRKLHSSTRTH